MTEEARTLLRAMTDEARERFQRSRSVLTFDQYLELFAENPLRYGRDSARWLRDLFDHYGTTTVERPYGTFTRWSAFDLPWEDDAGRTDALVGQEPLQREVYRAVSNFARQGRVERLLLLHGPNGSAKSTFAACVMRAMEHYSTLDEGALYRFQWVFPRGKGGAEGRIGFGAAAEDAGPRPGESYATLEESQIDARVPCDLRDHPMLLLPLELRRKLLAKLFPASEPAPAMLWRGGLSHKSNLVFEALRTAYRGDLQKVLAHVQVERWYVSRRYRSGAVTVGPQMAVDAAERQLTVSRSLSGLPASLQTVALFETHGDLVDASGGLIEYSDLLKRPLEAWKYLLLLVEGGELPLSASTLAPNVVFLGSSNEGHLDAFREHPEFPSFRGRFELLRAPYLLDWKLEERLYERQVRPGVRRHCAPHAIELGALFAVLTRMRKPSTDRLPRLLASLAADLSPTEKADLYALGAVPQRLNAEQARDLRAGVEALFHETDSAQLYEGRVGASPREMRTLLLDAAQSRSYRCLSPYAVFDELGRLAQRKNEFEWLRLEPQAGGYHDVRHFQKALRDRLLDTTEQELREATGLIDEARHAESFERYVQHVNAWVKGEKLHDRVTGRDMDPDQELLRRTEVELAAQGTAAEYRRGIMSSLAAWALDHPGEMVDYASVFPRQLQRLRDQFYAERRKQIAAIARDTVLLLGSAGEGLDAERTERARATAKRLTDRYGYCEHCAHDALSALLKERLHDAH